MIREAAVIGHPISHSLSPSIFGFLTHRLEIRDFHYRAHDVRPEDLAGFVETFRKNPKGLGFNATIPHKEALLGLLDELSPEAQTIGAVNVVHRKEGRLKGYNTDVYGILRTFESHSVAIQGKRALLIGAGGAARAVAYALASQNASHVTLLSSNRSRVQALIDDFQPRFKDTCFEAAADWSDLPSHDWTLIAQSTPLGMASQPKTRDGISAADYFSKMSRLSWTSPAWAFDLIYRPEWTPFLEQAQKLGLHPLGGLEMLAEQALETWRIWLGENPQADLMDYLRHRPIFLTGFMGSGKSTIGPLLAKRLKWNFVETDAAIEKKTGLSISEIFKIHGEPFFRETERQIIEETAYSPRTVVSLGGGALNSPTTLELLKKSGRLVYLSADLNTLDQRLKRGAQTRPLLAGLSDEQRRQKIASLLKEREPFYNQASLVLNTASLSTRQAVEKITENYL
jgi:shikimate dehydrogenase